MKSSLFVKRLSPILRITFVLIFLGLQAGLPLNGILDSAQAASLPEADAAPAREVEPAPAMETGVAGKTEPRPLMAAEASVSLGMPSDVMLGENFSFTVTFDNTSATSTDVGYGPFIDLVFPLTGESELAGQGGDDGIDFASANYLGNDLESDEQIFPDDGGGVGCVSHPWLRDATGAYVDVCGDAGDKFVSLRLPFGSFVPDQPALDITVNATMSDYANLSTPAMVIRARGGYMYGETALDDWCCGDTPFASHPSTDSDDWPGDTVTPQVMTFSKAYVGPGNTQDETATGPNYIHQYALTVEIAAGQTLTDLDITDLLPDNVQYIGINAATTAGYTLASEPSTSNPGGTLVLNYASATGTIDVVFDFYIPHLYDNTGAGTTFDDAVISPTTGDDVNSKNIAWAEGDWDPTDPDDDPETLSSDATCPTCPPLHTLEDKSIAIQKSVSVVGGGDPAPGQILEYSLNFQVSDYFSFGDIVITDTVSDGQHVRLASDFVPTLQVDGNSYTLATDDFDSTNYDITCNYTGSTLTAPTECTILGGGGTGETTLTFRVSDEIINDGENGDMVGGCVDDGGAGLVTPCDPTNTGDGPTTATLIFRTEIQEDFTDAYPSGDDSVDQGDHLDNTASVLANVLDNSTFAVVSSEDDDATASINIGRESLTKTIYAINDDDNSANWETDASGNYIVSPGDKITYRLEYGLNTSDVEKLTFDDYFPLPVFDVDDPEQDGSSGPAWVFSSTVGIPAAGVVQRASTDTFYNYMTSGLSGGTGTITDNDNDGDAIAQQDPIVTSDADANKIIIAFDDYDDTRNQSTKVDLLFSLVVSDDAFADGLFLTNMAHAYEGTTNGDDGSADAIIKFVIGEPVLVGTKGVVWTGNPNAVFDPATTGPGGVSFNDPSNSPRWTGTINSNGLDTNPIDSNVSGVDASDTITFAITIENQGSSLKGAFDITLRDILYETFYQIPAGGINLQIYYGDGSGPITYQYNPSGGACTSVWPGDPCGPDGVSGTADDIFGDGIRMDDPVGEGACQAHDPNSGNNVIMLTYDLEIRPDVEPDTGVNTVTLMHYAGSEGGPNHLPEDKEDDAEATVDIPSIDKYLVDTSEADTSDSPLRLAIGEIIRYRLAVTIPEGSMPNFQLDDNLPGGLTYLDDGTARVGFISNGLGIVSSNFEDVPALGACLISGNSVGDIIGALPCALADYNVGRTTATSFPSGDDNDTYPTSRDPQFKLGTIQNSDADDDAELVVVEFNVLVDNHSGSGQNDITERRRNNFNLYITIDGNRTGFGRSNNVDGRIEEPVIIDLAKSATLNTGDAGDTIAYQVTFSNSRGGGTTSYVSTAFDVVFTDTVPTKMDSISARTLAFAPAACGVLTSDTLVGNDITLNFSTLDAGCQVTIDYTANLTTAVTPGETLVNSAQILYTSLLGDKGTDPNPTGSTVEDGDGADTTDESGEINGERNGTGVDEPNDYHDEATAPVDVIFSATKTLVSTSLADTAGSDLTIGEIARFRMIVQLGEGTSPGFIFTDNLPNGLQFIDDNSAKFAFVSNGAGISSSTLTCTNDNGSAADIVSLPSANVDCDLTGAISGSPFNDGTDPVFSLGDLANTDSDGDSEFVVLEFNARLVNAAPYQSGGSATNNFSVEIDGIDRGTSDDVTVDFVEPVLNIAKSASADTDWLYGETVTYTLDIAHDATSNAPAYDIIVTDTVPTGLTYVNGTISAPAGWTTNVSGASLTWTCTASPCSLPAPLTFQATVDSPPSATALDETNSTATNTANMTWTSLPGVDSGERDGSGSSGGDAWDDYHTSDSHTGELALVAIGNLVWYDTGAGANYNNGVFNGDETGVDGVDIELYLSTQTPGVDTPVKTTTTAGGGFYEFDRLLPDTYFVYIPTTEFDGGATSTLMGYRSTTGNGANETDDHNVDENGIDVTNLATDGIRTPDYILQRDGETTTDDETSYTGALDDDNVNFTADFGFVELVAIGNRVWLDTGTGADYNDGEFDAGETPVDNVTINLYTSTGTFLATVDTAGGGYYEFDNLLPGQYYVSIPATEFQAGGDLVGYVSTTTTGNNETSDNDVDENGIDANVAVNGIRTRVYDLQPNTEIKLEDESNYTGAWDDDNVNFTADLSFVKLVAIGNRVWLDTGAGSGILDNGIQEAGEPGIDGVDIQLFHVGDNPSSATPVSTTTTATMNGEAGSYEFDQLNPGNYFVHIPASEFAGGGTLAGYYSSTGNGSDETSDQNADENGIDTALLSTNGISSTAYTLDIGTETTTDDQTTYTGYLDNANVNFTADFGFLQKVAIGNIVWLDNGAGGAGIANNGIMDGTEAGISGVDLELYHVGDTPGTSPTVATTTTDTNGQYFFDTLLPGDYFIFIPANEFQAGGDLVNLRSSTGNGSDETTDEDSGDENGIDSASTPDVTGIRSTNYTLQPNTEQTGEDQTNYTGSLVDASVNFTADFGFTELVAIGNRVWFDMGTNADYNDGEFDAGETPADNITIELYGVGPDNTPETADDTSHGSVDTAGGGYYFFDNLYPGEYYVRIPAAEFASGDLVGYVSTTVTGNDEITDNNADENGIDVATLTTTGIRTRVYDLQPNDEVTAEDESNYTGVWDDDNVNFTADLSFVQLVAIGNRVWFDTGAGGGTADNGIQEVGEAGVNGVRVELYTSGGTFVDFTTTDASGDYYFDNLNPGDYYVFIPANQFDDAGDALFGYFSSTGNGAVNDDSDHDVDENGIDEADLPTNGIHTPTYRLTPDLEPVSDIDTGYSGYLDDNNVNLTADFGFLQFVAIGNRVWLDTGAAAGHYNNGILDADESGLDGITVNLYTSAGALVDSTTTSTHLTESGYYEFDRLLPGSYYVQIPASEFQSGNLLFDYVSTTVTGADETTDNNADENGIDVSTLTTTGIRTRDYDLQPNTMPTADDQVNYTGVLDNDNVNFTADFSFVQLVALGNRVWFDTGVGVGGIPDNGIQDGGELGVNNVTLQLFHVGDNPASATPVATTSTDANGNYQFDLLIPDDYFVHIPASQFQGGGALEGYHSSTGNGSDEISDQDADENGIDTIALATDGISSTPYTLAINGETTADDETSYTGYLDNNNVNFTADFGFLQFVAIGNRVWLDTGVGGGTANNGILDGAEVGVDNVTVELHGVGLDGVAGTADDTSLGSVDTSGSGYYFFDHLLPGSYYLHIPAVEFTGSEALAGYLSSTGNGANETTDEVDINGDENGIDDAAPWTNGITGTVYDLQPNTEITGEAQPNYTGGLDDDNVNFTADFGFQNNPQVDLGITKDDGQIYYLAGSTLAYTITVINNGPIDVTGAIITDAMPLDSGSAPFFTSWDWVCTSSTGGATGCDPVIGSTTDFSDTINLPVNATITYTVNVIIDASMTETLNNMASIVPPGGYVDIDPTNDSDTDTDNPASLIITKDDGYTVVAPGSMLTYTIDINNNGAVDLTGLIVTDTLPDEVDYISSSDSGSEAVGVVTWPAFDLVSGASTQRTLAVQVKDTADLGSATSLTNNVSIVDDGTTGVTDDDDDIDDIALTNTKALIDTNHAATTLPEVTIGEILTYRINIVIPAGATMTNLRAVDVLETGLAFDECQAITSTDLESTLNAGDPTDLSGACPLGGNSNLLDPAVTNSGHNITFNFGDVTNTHPTENRTLTLEYWVDVLDIAENASGVDGINNAVEWRWDGGSLSGEALPVEIIEPDMDIEKTTTSTVATLGSIVPFSIEIYQTDASTANAYDVVVTDILPEALEYVTGSESVGSPIPYDSFAYDNTTRTLTFVWDYFPLNAPSDPTQRARATITFDTLFVGPAPVINEANVAWTSLPIDPSDPEYIQSKYNEDSTERWYDPADQSSVDDYGRSSSVEIRTPALPQTGFAPNRVTAIPAQLPAQSYHSSGDAWIEIPDLNVTLPIVGVPLRNDGWDLTWLDDQAGYLEGSAYLGQAGNTAITAHVYLSDGSPGPFVDLHTLYWGKIIKLHANGQVYTYQVREKRKVWPQDISVLKHEDYDWITLITCQKFNEKLGDYDYRIALRAVLIEVQPEK